MLIVVGLIILILDTRERRQDKRKRDMHFAVHFVNAG